MSLTVVNCKTCNTLRFIDFDDFPLPCEASRVLLRPIAWQQPIEDDGVLDYVAATVQNGAERHPWDGCWSGRWHSYDEIRGDQW